MIIGTTKELKNHEYRVGLTPDNVQAYTRRGHEVYIETGAGLGAGFTDEEYKAAGAQILATPKEVFDIAEMIVKVKEPEPCEYELLREGQILYTYLHLAANPELDLLNAMQKYSKEIEHSYENNEELDFEFMTNPDFSVENLLNIL